MDALIVLTPTELIVSDSLKAEKILPVAELAYATQRTRFTAQTHVVDMSHKYLNEAEAYKKIYYCPCKNLTILTATVYSVNDSQLFPCE